MRKLDHISIYFLIAKSIYFSSPRSDISLQKLLTLFFYG